MPVKYEYNSWQGWYYWPDYGIEGYQPIGKLGTPMRAITTAHFEPGDNPHDFVFMYEHTKVVSL